MKVGDLVKDVCGDLGIIIKNTQNAVSYTHLTLPTIYSV